MKTTVRRTLAATTICAAVAATLAAGPLASAEQANAGAHTRKISNFGYKGTAVGAKLVTGNVQTLSAKDAVAPLRCTRMTGRSVEQSSLLEAPENSLIDLSASTSRTVSYRNAGQYGVRAINTLGDITLGGDLGGGQMTPIVSLRGLTTTADAFHTAKGYGHKEGFTAPELVIDISVLEESGVPIPPELTDLLDTLATTGGELTGQVISVLNEAGVIEIPELGSIAMGYKKGHAGKHGAESDVKALEFKITATGEEQTLQLGQARAVIGGPTPGGVFRSTSMPLDIKALDGALHFGGVKPRTIPCQGTQGRTVTRTLDSASIAPNGLAVKATGIAYTFRGTQHRNGTANGFDAQRIGSLEIPALQLVINDIVARSSAKTTEAGGKVKKSHSGSVGSIVYQGETLAAPAPGKVLNLGDVGYIEGLAVDSTKWGDRVTALRLTLLQENLVIDLGIAASQVFAY